MERTQQEKAKHIRELINSWPAPDDAYGCPKCDKGMLVGYSPPKGNAYAQPFYKQYVAAWTAGDITVCDCSRGQKLLKWFKANG